MKTSEIKRIVESNPKVIVKMNKYQEALNCIVAYDKDITHISNGKEYHIDVLQELIDKYNKLVSYLKEQSVSKGNQYDEFANGCACGYENTMSEILDYIGEGG